jgi:hypothetical protein
MFLTVFDTALTTFSMMTLETDLPGKSRLLLSDFACRTDRCDSYQVGGMIRVNPWDVGLTTPEQFHNFLGDNRMRSAEFRYGFVGVLPMETSIFWRLAIGVFMHFNFSTTLIEVDSVDDLSIVWRGYRFDYESSGDINDWHSRPPTFSWCSRFPSRG